MILVKTTLIIYKRFGLVEASHRRLERNNSSKRNGPPLQQYISTSIRLLSVASAQCSSHYTDGRHAITIKGRKLRIKSTGSGVPA
jgi:hypothetical protein